MVNVCAVENAVQLHENVVQTRLRLYKLIKIGTYSDSQSCDKMVIKGTEDVISKIVTVLVLSQRSLALTIMPPNHSSIYLIQITLYCH